MFYILCEKYQLGEVESLAVLNKINTEGTPIGICGSIFHLHLKWNFEQWKPQAIDVSLMNPHLSVQKLIITFCRPAKAQGTKAALYTFFSFLAEGKLNVKISFEVELILNFNSISSQV